MPSLILFRADFKYKYICEHQTVFKYSVVGEYTLVWSISIKVDFSSLG